MIIIIIIFMIVLREANCSKNSRRNGWAHSSTRDSRSGGHHAPGQQHHHHYHYYHSHHHYHQPNHYHSLHHPHLHHIQVCNIFESTFKPQMKAHSNQAKAKGGKVCTCAACQSINCGRWVKCFDQIIHRLEICQKNYTTQFLGKRILQTENAKNDYFCEQ